MNTKTIMSKSKKKKIIDLSRVTFTVSNDIPDLDNHPFIIESAKQAAQFLKKHGLPEAFTKKHK